MRDLKDIMHNGRSLADILSDHAKWLRVEGGERANLARAYLAGADLAGASLYGANLAGANLAGADLAGADLAGADLAGANLYGVNLYGVNLYGATLGGANLCGANLDGCAGNMTEILTAHFDRWACAWIMAPDGTAWLQIGCQRHTVAEWEAGDDDWISGMDPHALGWWEKYRDPLLALVKAAPAKPWGKAGEAA